MDYLARVTFSCDAVLSKRERQTGIVDNWSRSQVVDIVGVYMAGAMNGDRRHLCGAIHGGDRGCVDQRFARVEHLHCGMGVVERVDPHAGGRHAEGAMASTTLYRIRGKLQRRELLLRRGAAGLVNRLQQRRNEKTGRAGSYRAVTSPEVGEGGLLSRVQLFHSRCRVRDLVHLNRGVSLGERDRLAGICNDDVPEDRFLPELKYGVLKILVGGAVLIQEGVRVRRLEVARNCERQGGKRERAEAGGSL